MKLAEMDISKYSGMEIMDDRIEMCGNEDTWVIPLTPQNEVRPEILSQWAIARAYCHPEAQFHVLDSCTITIPRDPVEASIRYWSKRYGRTLTREEVMPLIERVKAFYDLLYGDPKNDAVLP